MMTRAVRRAPPTVCATAISDNGRRAVRETNVTVRVRSRAAVARGKCALAPTGGVRRGHASRAAGRGVCEGGIKGRVGVLEKTFYG
jgi:hypothetical protein